MLTYFSLFFLYLIITLFYSLLAFYYSVEILSKFSGILGFKEYLNVLKRLKIVYTLI